MLSTWPGSVTLHGLTVHLTPFFFDQGLCFHSRLRTPGDNDDVRAGFGQTQSDPFSKPLASARHNSGFPL